MGNIFDYLDWRGDISFAADPFNEVDNLILSWLAYADFEGVLKNRAVDLGLVGDGTCDAPGDENYEEHPEVCPGSYSEGACEDRSEETFEDLPEGKNGAEYSAGVFENGLRGILPDRFEDQVMEKLNEVPEKIRDLKEAAQPDWLKKAKARAIEIGEGVRGRAHFTEEDELTIQEACLRYYQLHTPEEIAERESFIRLAPFMLAKLYDSKRYSNLRLKNYVNWVCGEDDVQFSAITYEVGDGTHYVAFRGTDDTIVGWKEDFNLSYNPETPGQAYSAAYLNGAPGGPLRVGGHSKGGNFACYAAVFADASVRGRILKVYSNDGPGFLSLIADSEEFKSMLPKMVKIIPESSMIGILMDSHVETEIIKSSENGIMQHDAVTWEVLGNRFVRAEQRSGGSVFVDRTVRDWIDGIDSEERKNFVDNLFEIVDGAGVSLVSDISVKSAVNMIRGYNSLPEEERKQFRGVLGKLVQSGARALKKEE